MGKKKSTRLTGTQVFDCNQGLTATKEINFRAGVGNHIWLSPALEELAFPEELDWVLVGLENDLDALPLKGQFSH